MHQKIKDWIVTAREGLLVLVFIVILIFPQGISSWMKKANIQKLVGPGFEVELQEAEKSKAEIQTAGATVSEIERKLEETTASLQKLEKVSTNDSSKKAIKTLIGDIQQSTDNIQKVDNKLKNSLIRQENIIQSIRDVSLPKIGWIFLGRVNENRTQWVGGKPQTVETVSPQELKESVLTIRDNVYLRDDTQDKFRNAAPILTVIKEGEQVKVLDIDYSSARGGGAFVWVKVERLSN